MTSRGTLVSLFATFAAIGLAYVVSVNHIDDVPVQVMLSILYAAAIFGITGLLRRQA